MLHSGGDEHEEMIYDEGENVSDNDETNKQQYYESNEEVEDD